MRKVVELKARWIRGSGALLAYLQELEQGELVLLSEALKAEITAIAVSGSCSLGHPDCGRNLGHLRRLREMRLQVEEQLGRSS